MLVMAGALWLAACGGDVTTGPPPAGSAPATPAAVIALSTEGTLAPGTTIGGLGVTVNLPDSVSVKRDGSGNVDSSVVTTSGVAAGQATVIALYSAATATEPAKLHIALASGSSGMTVGEFAMITCTVPAGDGPAAADFSLSDFAPVDTSGAAIPSLSADLRSVE
jgi:hypothetical protein